MNVQKIPLVIPGIFPEGHIKEGQETKFKELILSGRKTHIIQPENIVNWMQLEKKVNTGTAVINLYEKTEDHIEPIADLNQIRVQSISINPAMCPPIKIDYVPIKSIEFYFKLVHNEGLRVKEFISYFPKPILYGTIIHFKDFIYTPNKI